MNIEFLGEPELEFGAGRHIDIRFGIMSYGPLDFAAPVAPSKINIGIIGSKDSVEGVRIWFERCKGENPANPIKKPNLIPTSPTFAKETPALNPVVRQDLAQPEI